jgi:hypothetical protein
MKQTRRLSRSEHRELIVSVLRELGVSSPQVAFG